VSDDIKRIDIAEFRALGFVQEINRRILHPCGLALEVNVAEDGTETLGGVWDYRDDPEGMIYGPDMIDAAKAATVNHLMLSKEEVRCVLFDSIIQPVTS
jgi:hypothetical protein